MQTHFFFFLFSRLFKISDNTYGSAYSDDNANLDSNIGSVKMIQTEMNEGKSWKYNNSKQKPQYSDIYMFTARSDFSASEIREGILKAPSFSLAPQPHEVQGNSLLFHLVL